MNCLGVIFPPWVRSVKGGGRRSKVWKTRVYFGTRISSILRKMRVETSTLHEIVQRILCQALDARPSGLLVRAAKIHRPQLCLVRFQLARSISLCGIQTCFFTGQFWSFLWPYPGWNVVLSSKEKLWLIVSDTQISYTNAISPPQLGEALRQAWGTDGPWNSPTV